MNERNPIENIGNITTQMESSIAFLKQIDFELAYLALLTRDSIKPLSRWEKPLEDRDLKSLEAMGLYTKRIKRTAKSEHIIQENIFSLSYAHIELYAKRFDDKPIEKSDESQRFEGFLFGYPPCCIEQYINKPYTKNKLDEKDQKILFHWACNNCKITPFLLCNYKKTYEFVKNL